MPGQRLRALRDAVKMSRPEFSAHIGVPETTLKNYELRDRKVSYDVCMAISHVYGENGLLYMYGLRTLKDVI